MLSGVVFRLMQVTRSIVVVLCASLVMRSGFAQNMFKFTFRGTCTENNPAGKFVNKPVSDRTWLQDVAAAAGVSSRDMRIVYHLQGNALGDTIDVINATNGTVYQTLFGFYFGEDFGRQSLRNAAGNANKRIDYIYTSQSDHSLGDALNSKTFSTNRNGSIRLVLQGQMNYLVLPAGTNGLKVCSGTFTGAGTALSFTNAP